MAAMMRKLTESGSRPLLDGTARNVTLRFNDEAGYVTESRLQSTISNALQMEPFRALRIIQLNEGQSMNK